MYLSSLRFAVGSVSSAPVLNASCAFSSKYSIEGKTGLSVLDNIFFKLACARAPPTELLDALRIPQGLNFKEDSKAGLDAQSIAFFNAPGIQ